MAKLLAAVLLLMAEVFPAIAGDYDGIYGGNLSEGKLSAGTMPRSMQGCPGNGNHMTLVVSDNQIHNDKDPAAHKAPVAADGSFTLSYSSSERVVTSTLTYSGRIVSDGITNGVFLAGGSFSCTYTFTAKRQ